MMALALVEAGKGWGRTSPNPMVGAVIVKDGRILARGYHARAGGPHAEVEAIRQAGSESQGATIYVTLEPCNHFGRTPPCTQAILEAGLARVVIGSPDPNPQVKGGGAEFLASRGLEITSGVLLKESAEVIKFFTKFITTGRPFVLLKVAATLDGKIATHTGHSRWVTGPEARALVHRLRNGLDAILVGKNTILVDDPTLNTRSRAGPKKDPIRIVLDTRLELPISSRVLDPETGGPTIIACGPEHDPQKADELRQRGLTVWPLPLVNNRISLASLLDRLGQAKVTSLLIEGGAEVAASALLEEKIVDELMFFLAPKIVGGRTAPTLTGGQGVITMDQALPVDIIKFKKVGQDLLVVGVPHY